MNVRANATNAQHNGASMIPRSHRDKSPQSKRRPEYATDSDLDDCLEDISYLWPGWIPNAQVTCFAGFGDAGKSTVLQDLCRRLLTGQPWPDGQPNNIDPNNIMLLWLDTECSQAIFRQRLIDWGMPRGRFILPRDPLHDIQLDSEEDWEWIKCVIEDFRSPLVVLDSLSGGHSGDENKNDFMKKIMKRLAKLAQASGVAIVVVHHLGKPAPGAPDWPITMNMLRGATSIPQYCRSVIGLGTPNKNEPLSHGFMHVKHNLGPKSETIGYTLTATGPDWGDAPPPFVPRRAINDAIDFLRERLKSGMALSDEVNAEAKARSIGMNALNDAKKVLGVKPKREGSRDGRWVLTMPECGPADDSEEEGAT